MYVRAPEYGYQIWVHKGIEKAPLTQEASDRAWEAELTEEILGG
jgi:hypothetical protein